MKIKDLFKNTDDFVSVEKMFGISPARRLEIHNKWNAVTNDKLGDLLKYCTEGEEMSKEAIQKVYRIMRCIESFTFYMYGDLDFTNESELLYFSSLIYRKYNKMIETMPISLRAALKMAAKAEVAELINKNKSDLI